MAERDDPSVQIRERSYIIDTDSLTRAGNEPVPEEIIRDLLITEWVETENTPRPRIMVADEQIQVDFGREDIISITISDYNETPTGHRHEYVDVAIPMEIEIMTMESRQRMWNMMGEVRRIIYRWMVALLPYELLSFNGFRPDYNGPRNFSGVINVSIEAGAVPILSRRHAGNETPNTDPEDFDPNEILGGS